MKKILIVLVTLTGLSKAFAAEITLEARPATCINCVYSRLAFSYDVNVSPTGTFSRKYYLLRYSFYPNSVEEIVTKAELLNNPNAISNIDFALQRNLPLTKARLNCNYVDGKNYTRCSVIELQFNNLDRILPK